MKRSFNRKVTNVLALSLSVGATAIGLLFLGAILWTLLKNGFAGMSLQLFTQMTPPPGSAGGLLNAIFGSAVMTLIGIAVGAPVGVLAGTYLAEYGGNSRLSSVIRFVNDVLLSAPSIIIGLFVYQIVVVPMGHFSAIAGALALAVIAIPASAIAPAIAEKCPIGTTTIWYTNRPTMIEGALSSTSFTKRMSADSFELPPYSAR